MERYGGVFSISSIGEVRKFKGAAGWKDCSTYIDPAGYVRVNMEKDDGTWVDRFVHRLVCLTFNGSPDKLERKYVNHKDGNKTNNHFSNLEWCTSKENSQHALDNNLCFYPIAVVIENISTGKSLKAYSKEHAARLLGVSVTKVDKALGRYPNYLINETFRLKVDLDNHLPAKHQHAIEVLAKDYVTGKVMIFPNIKLAEIVTGVSKSSITKSVLQDSERNVAGYVFREYGKKTKPFPHYSAEESKKLRETYFNKCEKDGRCLSKNHVTGEIKKHSSHVMASKITGVKAETIGTLLHKSSLLPVKGYSFKKEGNDEPFPEYSRHSIEASKMRKGRGAKPLKVTDVIAKKENVYASIKDFALANDVSRSNARNHMLKYPNKPLMGRWLLEEVQL